MEFLLNLSALLKNDLSSEKIWGVVAIGLALIFFVVNRPKNSLFKLKEHERTPSKAHTLFNTEAEKKQKPLPLPGIVIDGPAHEVLGVAWDAPPEKIEQAFKEKMKNYHPDKIATQGSQQWHDAQKVAQALNEARKKLLEKNRKKS